MTISRIIAQRFQLFLGLIRRFTASAQGVAGTEFALLLPVMIALIMGGYEFSRAYGASTRTTYLANGLAELVSQSTIDLTDADLNLIIESAPLLNPDIISYARATGRADFWNVAEVVISSVQFSPRDPACTAKCKYEADMVFSHARNGTPKSCTKAAAAAAVPSQLAGEGSLIVVDIAVPYKPLFTQFVPVSLKFERTVYLRPRYINRVELTKNCPGF